MITPSTTHSGLESPKIDVAPRMRILGAAPKVPETFWHRHAGRAAFETAADFADAVQFDIRGQELVGGSGKDTLVHLLHTGYYDRCDLLRARFEHEVHAVGVDLLLDRVVSQEGYPQHGPSGNIFERIESVDRCRGGIVRADDLDDGACQRCAVLFGYFACYHAVLRRGPAHYRYGEQDEYGQFFHRSVIEVLGSGAQAGPWPAKVAARLLHRVIG